MQGYYNEENSSYYLCNGKSFWTMSPCSYFSSDYAYTWLVENYGSIWFFYVTYNLSLRPVINLNANVLATGTGTSTDPYVVITE